MIKNQQLDQSIKENCKHFIMIKYEELMKTGKVKPFITHLWSTSPNSYSTLSSEVELYICLYCKRMMWEEVKC